jgi:hypothetical protein
MAIHTNILATRRSSARRLFGPEMRTARGYEPGKNWDEPMYNVFRKDADGTARHFWGSELL